LRSLRGTCNFLLAGTCLFELFHELSHFVALYNTTLGGNFIDFGTCLYIQLPFLGGLLAVQASLFATAVDRLIAVFAPIKFVFLLIYQSEYFWQLVRPSLIRDVH
jgi:hypothetical protein